MEPFAEIKPKLGADEALAEANRCLMCFDAPCTRACPTHIDVPGFIKKIASGNLRGSARTILQANILGASCARVCPTEVLCEGACVLNDVHHKPIQIGQLQRHATDWLLAKDEPLFHAPATAKTGVKVAIVGAGPAGLSCAVELVRLGFSPVLFDANKKPGGLNTYGCAEYKITADFALREVEWVKQHGVEVKSGVTVGKDITAAELERDYAAVFVGIGMGAIARLGLPGEELDGVWDALDLIALLKSDRARATAAISGKRVIVLGGGNTAIDAVTQAAALGASEVSLVYRRGPEEMSAYAHERELAHQVGCRFVYLAAPKAVVGAGKVEALTVERMQLGAPDADGRRKPVPIPGAVEDLPCDVVIKATGQASRAAWLEACGVRLERGRVAVDKEWRTSNPRWFAAGDCVSGGQEVVNAVADGKKAAQAIAAQVSRSGATQKGTVALG